MLSFEFEYDLCLWSNGSQEIEIWVKKIEALVFVCCHIVKVKDICLNLEIGS